MGTTNIALPYTQRVEQVSSVAVAGQQAYFVPWGTYLRGVDVLAVEVNGVPVVAGVDYVPMIRQARTDVPWMQPTTADVVRGVWMTPAPPAAATVKITFVVRDLQIAPPVPTTVFAPAGSFQYPALPGDRETWNYSPSSASIPLQVAIAGRAGFQVEFWRKSKGVGETRTPRIAVPQVPQIRFGKHWSPYWRTGVAVADGLVVVDTSDPALMLMPWNVNERRQYRLAYYDPASGARSGLSDLTLFVAQRADTLAPTAKPGYSSVSHHSRSAWVAK